MSFVFTGYADGNTVVDAPSIPRADLGSLMAGHAVTFDGISVQMVNATFSTQPGGIGVGGEFDITQGGSTMHETVYGLLH